MSRTAQVLPLVWCLAVADSSRATVPPPVPDGKVDTGRSIEISIVVDGTPAEAFACWSTPAGIARFFASEAVVEPRVGGRYEVIFAPEIDPDGSSQGTKGARILAWAPPHRLSFEWATFVTSAIEIAGYSHPPVVSVAERYSRPYPVWVDLDIRPVEGTPGRTEVHLWSRGFEQGEKWDEALRYFQVQWASILGRFAAVCAGGAAETPSAR